MARVAFTPRARTHLRLIREHIARDSPAAAGRMVQCIRHQAASLADFPRRGRVVPEYDDPAIRELIVAPYRVVYRHDAARSLIQIIAVYHGSQLMPPSAPDT